MTQLTRVIRLESFSMFIYLLLVDDGDLGGDEWHGADGAAHRLARQVVRLRRDLEHVLHAGVEVSDL